MKGNCIFRNISSNQVLEKSIIAGRDRSKEMLNYLEHDVAGGDVHLQHGDAGDRTLVSAGPGEAAPHVNLGLVPAAEVFADGQIETILWWFVLK